jgi:hypothetical protein
LQEGKTFLERLAPRWFVPLNVDRFRRRITAVSLGPRSGFGPQLYADIAQDWEILQRLASLPALKYRFLDIDHITRIWARFDAAGMTDDDGRSVVVSS